LVYCMKFRGVCGRLIQMRLKSLFFLLSLLVAAGCSSTPSSLEPPSCGPPVKPEDVLIIDAEQVNIDGGFDAVVAYAQTQAGPFGLASTETVRANGTLGPLKSASGQKAAAEKGCDLLIFVGSKVQSHAVTFEGSGGGASRSLFFLMGLREK